MRFICVLRFCNLVLVLVLVLVIVLVLVLVLIILSLGDHLLFMLILFFLVCLVNVIVNK